MPGALSIVLSPDLNPGLIKIPYYLRNLTTGHIMIKSLRTLLFSSLLLILIACSPAATPLTPTQTISPRIPTPSATLTTAAPTPLGAEASPLSCSPSEFDSKCAYAQEQMLAVTIGTRVAGTPSGDRAGDYVAQQFASDGYQVEKQEFTFEIWEDLGTKLEYTSQMTGDLESQPIQYSPAGQIEGQVVAVDGAGDPTDFAKANVKGNIALVQRGTLQFYDKAKNAADAGATVILIYNNAPPLFGGTMRDRVSIPTIAISGREGQKLLDSMKQGAVTVKIVSNTQVSKKTGHNIIATKPGTNGKTFVLGGHYDTVAAGPGAVDNGTGTAVLIELARVLSKKDTKSTLIFIGFDAEEFGLIGSRYYTDHLSDADRAKITAMLNFDMMGGGKGPLGVGGDGAIGLQARKSASDLGIDARDFQLGNNSGSDHQSFTRLGIDSVFFVRDYDLLHTPQDAIDQVREDFLAEAGKVGLKAVLDFEVK
jgi:aminopeptidase YwaD